MALTELNSILLIVWSSTYALWRPVNQPRFAHDAVDWNRPAEMRIIAVVSIIAENKIFSVRDFHRS